MGNTHSRVKRRRSSFRAWSKMVAGRTLRRSAGGSTTADGTQQVRVSLWQGWSQRERWAERQGRACKARRGRSVRLCSLFLHRSHPPSYHVSRHPPGHSPPPNMATSTLVPSIGARSIPGFGSFQGPPFPRRNARQQRIETVRTMDTHTSSIQSVHYRNSTATT